MYDEGADDLTLVTDSMQQLIDALNVLLEEAAKVWLKVNWQKIKINAFEPQALVRLSEFITVCGAHVEAVANFTYFGSGISNDDSVDTKLFSRVVKASYIIRRLNVI